MKTQLFRFSFLIVTVSFAGWLSPLAYAASATMSLGSAGSAAKGSYVTVSIRENSGGEPVNAAAATLSYPTDKLAYVSISSSGAFPVVAANSGGGGSVRVDRGALTPVSGSQTVASITFRALTDSGTAVVSIASGSVYSASNNAQIYAGGSGTSIALKAPAAAAPAAPKDTIAPTLKDIKASATTASSVLVSWTTSEPANSEVSFGPSQNYGFKISDGNFVTDHKVALNAPYITPATDYHYAVKSSDAAGNATSSSDATFSSAGASLSVTIKSKSNKPLAGYQVEIAGKNGITDKQGHITIIGLPLGTHSLVISHKNKPVKSVQVKINSIDPDGKPIVASYTVPTSSSSLPTIVAIVALLGIGAAIAKAGGFSAALAGLKGRAGRFLGRGSAGASNTIMSPPADTSTAPTRRVEVVEPNKKK